MRIGRDAADAKAILLASASPRRQRLVELLGLPCRAEPQDLPEEEHALDDPALTALNVALAKARSAVRDARADEIVLAADTVVALDGESLAKPATTEDAKAMLRSLRARTHRVMTGVALRAADGREWAAVVETLVEMRGYGDDEIATYIGRGEPFDKAGGYAIQDATFRPVERLEGCYLNVVGLPLCAVARGLETLGAWVSFASGGMQPPCGYCDAGACLVEITST